MIGYSVLGQPFLTPGPTHQHGPCKQAVKVGGIHISTDLQRSWYLSILDSDSYRNNSGTLPGLEIGPVRDGQQYGKDETSFTELVLPDEYFAW